MTIRNRFTNEIIYGSLSMNRALIVLGLVLMLVSVFGCATWGQESWREASVKPFKSYERRDQGTGR